MCEHHNYRKYLDGEVHVIRLDTFRDVENYLKHLRAWVQSYHSDRRIRTRMLGNVGLCKIQLKEKK